ncbi:MAG: sulfotransferase [Pseudomonadales bacterium]|nr:sulfotransferase [Pseudomonadales bacterium]
MSSLKHALVTAINQGGLAFSRHRLPELNAAALIEQARQIACWDDFGDQDPGEGLSVLFDSYEHDSRLNVIGRFAMRQDALHMLVNRLGLERRRRQETGIAAEVIRQPVFILGLPRTGTTLLHNLLSLDPAHRSPLTWELMYPLTAGSAAARQQSIRAARKRSAWLDWLAPNFQKTHEVNVEQPQECIQITGHSFESHLFEAMCRVPGYQRWLAQRSLEPAYRLHQRFLQHLQYQQTAHTWVLKAPAHMMAIEALLTVYPDARIVQTHRDPRQVMPSLASLHVLLRRAFSEQVDSRAVGAEILARWQQALQLAMQARDTHPGKEHVWVDMFYDRLLADPITAMEGLYESFGRSLTGATADRMRAFLAVSPRHKFGAHRYQPGDFGMSEQSLGQDFAGYCQRYGIPRENA